MSLPVSVTIHPSQFPDAVSLDLLESLRRRRVNHKFHYDSAKQTQKWLALHRAYSPSATDADCAAIYDQSFSAVAAEMNSSRVHLIGLGCGGGQKDTRLLHLLAKQGRQVEYTPSDVSVAMVLVAREAAISVVSDTRCHPLVCDLATADDLPEYFKSQIHPDAARLFTFFGMIPNFEPQLILPRLAAMVRPKDQLLFSANLAPGGNYHEGVQKVLALYDNPETRDWLVTFLYDLGVESGDGKIHFAIEDNAEAGLKRITVNFRFARERKVVLGEESLSFASGESMRLFYSYRHTPQIIDELLAQHGFAVRQQWVANSGEEGVFWCVKIN